MQIDWSRIARPQDDGYDTEVALALRPPPRQADPGVPTGRRIFDGAVEVRELAGPYAALEGFAAAPPDSPEIDVAEHLVAHWPAVYRQFQELVRVIYPMRAENWPRQTGTVKGSASHAFESHLGTLCATVADPVGLAQALVHELGHTKLRCLGVWLESADRLITNDPGERFESPVRKDEPRPMTAVLHAEYSFTYLTHLDLVLLEACGEPELRRHVLALLERNVPRIAEGFDTVRRHVRVDADGRRFVDSFLAWAEATIRSGERRLAAAA
ncbi:MAG TPA: HEXXH motif-containing putative peptide modification protein [Thermoanaerobaculia bacterium]|nr:HEXXH motif-containing putative peptide modification protein [Thermoanaerobaculia bacterium]